MLQSSPKDRRAIFEEASGISRFKAKKIEALRRLERVDQNLLRLTRHCRRSRKPVEKRAGSGGQSPALQRTRRPVAAASHASWPGRLAQPGRATGGDRPCRCWPVRPEISAATTAAADAETHAESLEQQTGEVDREIHAAESQLADNRQRSATIETTIEHERIRAARFGRVSRPGIARNCRP